MPEIEDPIDVMWTSTVGTRVRVIANDYSYTGWVMCVFRKRRGTIRVVVEDENGRLFIHNPSQLRSMDE